LAPVRVAAKRQRWLRSLDSRGGCPYMAIAARLARLGFMLKAKS
jgi:hypothetical protein